MFHQRHTVADANGQDLVVEIVKSVVQPCSPLSGFRFQAIRNIPEGP